MLSGDRATRFPPRAASEGVPGDLACVYCGYNLRTMAVEGVCPECGGAVADSLLLLDGGVRDWMRSAAAALVSIVAMSVVWIALATVAPFLEVVLLMGLAVAVLPLARNNPMGTTLLRLRRARRWLLVCLGFLSAGIGLSVGGIMVASWGSSWDLGYGLGVYSTYACAGLMVPVCLSTYLRELMCAIGRRDLARRCRLLFWVVPGVWCVVIPVVLDDALASTRLSMSSGGSMPLAFVVALFVLTVVILGMSLLIRCSRALDRVLRETKCAAETPNGPGGQEVVADSVLDSGNTTGHGRESP